MPSMSTFLCKNGVRKEYFLTPTFIIEPKKTAEETPLQSFSISQDYFSSTLAPASSSLAFIASASALETPSFRVLGAESTAALASFRPRPVSSRTTLITLILLAPQSVRTTSNSVFSAAAAPPAAGAAATATYAEFFFHSLNEVSEFEHSHALNGLHDFFFSHFKFLQNF